MKELKTLGKIVSEIAGTEDRGFWEDENVFSVEDDLRAEAVKWVKYGMDFNSKITFMQFFNLTEEDLK